MWPPSGRFPTIETRSEVGLRRALEGAGHSWAKVETDGLVVTLTGVAPSEAMRFRALNVAGSIVGASRIIDMLDVTDPLAIAAPEFSVEILRNDDGISVIGLIPAETEREALVKTLTGVAGEGRVTDLMESSAHPVPEGWEDALEFGLSALRTLPRSKISITAQRVAVTAITDSAAEKARIEADLARRAPDGVHLALDISAPRPVITPFTLRFLIDENGPRFDACSADTERAQMRIIAAATATGMTGKISCTIGMGVPTPEWANAASMGIAALAELGGGSITFSDADISLIAADSVSQADFDRVVGELESNLPEVFSLQSVLTEPTAAEASQETPIFTATLSEEGKVQLRGRLTDERTRDAVDSFARARFGNDAIYLAARLDPDLPDGWPVRVLAALEALAELNNGKVSVEPGLIRVEGVTGSTEARPTIARLLAARLGDTDQFDIKVRYVEKLDPLLGLPTPEECVADINAILTAAKISFDPGEATITADGAPILDRIAERMKLCSDVPMEIAGHTDSQGREEMNLALSQSRAQAVIVGLMERRVLTGNLDAQGYGETRPIADNDTEEGREANRRIEFTLIDLQARAAEAASAAEGEGADGALEGDLPADATGNATDDADPDADPDAETAAPDDQGTDDAGSGDGDPNAPPEDETGSGN